ncbi:hypothetical protein CDAR_464571 [Caerostris darwini]|uniref:Uncharacterized protein n=1 Tax=Caerostris darwini TaxID=1538125 RepID=A0AAV4Q9K8_9ARAC|nr:hypothetical protein CDAR_464571 [Caerostris darwini]
MVYIVDLNEKPFHPVSLLLALVAEQKRGLNSVPAANLNTSTGEHFDTEDLITDHNRLTLSPKKFSIQLARITLLYSLFFSFLGRICIRFWPPDHDGLRICSGFLLACFALMNMCFSSGNGKLWRVPYFILRSN